MFLKTDGSRWLPDHQAESMRESTNAAQIGRRRSNSAACAILGQVTL
jgi:hypothetical protein